MTPTEYEALVAQIAASIVERVDGAAAARITFGSTSHVRGASGYDHQIDVAIDGHEASLLIECKYWTSAVDVPRFLEFAARVHDIRSLVPTVRITAAIATTVGFDSGISLLASFFHIGIHVVTSPSRFAILYKHSLTLGAEGSEVRSESGIPSLQQGLVLTPAGSEVRSETGPSVS